MTLFLAATTMLNLQFAQTQCTLKTVLKNANGKTYEIAKPSSSLSASWLYRNTAYRLTSYTVDANELSAVPLLTQSVLKPLASSGPLRRQEQSVAYSLSPNKQIEQNSSQRITETENVSPEKKQIFEVLPDGHRNLLSTELEETSGDVTKREIAFNPNPTDEKDGFKVVSSDQACSTSIVDESAIQGDPVLKKAVDTFSNYLKDTKTVEAAFSQCLRNSPADCIQPMTAFEEKLAGVESAWNSLISVAELESTAK
jgi:hypothetical protein